MNYPVLIPFLIGMFILAASPGPGVMTSMARAVADGFRSSLYFIGGLVAGDIIFLVLALFGLSAIASIAGKLFLAVRIAGGLYLIYLGIGIFREGRMSAPGGKKPETSRFQTFVSGFLVTMGNPKPILFYASVLPSIIDFDQVRPLDALLMAVLIALVSFSVLGTYSYLASLSRKTSLSDRWQLRIHRIAGAIMVVAGVFVIFR